MEFSGNEKEQLLYCFPGCTSFCQSISEESHLIQTWPTISTFRILQGICMFTNTFDPLENILEKNKWRFMEETLIWDKVAFKLCP